MNLNEAITGRRAVREYTSDAVDEQTIRLLIEAAVEKLGPSEMPAATVG